MSLRYGAVACSYLMVGFNPSVRRVLAPSRMLGATLIPVQKTAYESLQGRWLIA